MSLKDEQEFILLLKDHKRILYKVINIYCKDKDDRLDLEQEIIIQLWKSFRKYNPEYKVSTFIYRIALNVAISYYRKDNIRRKKYTPFEDSIFEIGLDLQKNELEKEDLKLVFQFIEQLDKMSKALMILYLDGKGYKEIAEVLGISESNVGTKLNRIRQQLKEKFSKVNQ